jgi:hypothetical protein
MTTKKAVPKRSKPFNAYLREEDMGRIRELATFISSKGHRVSDSAVIAASLRVTKADAKFLKAFEEGLLLDARFKRDSDG